MYNINTYNTELSKEKKDIYLNSKTKLRKTFILMKRNNEIDIYFEKEIKSPKEKVHEGT